jgi:hypothetical protein
MTTLTMGLPVIRLLQPTWGAPRNANFGICGEMLRGVMQRDLALPSFVKMRIAAKSAKTYFVLLLPMPGLSIQLLHTYAGIQFDAGQGAKKRQPTCLMALVMAVAMLLARSRPHRFHGGLARAPLTARLEQSDPRGRIRCFIDGWPNNTSRRVARRYGVRRYGRQRRLSIGGPMRVFRRGVSVAVCRLGSARDYSFCRASVLQWVEPSG